jgi:hypothetical protein
MLRHDEYEKQPLKTFMSTAIFGCVPNGRIGDLKTIDVKMQTLNDGDIPITCSIIRYMGW